jgi:hypothetical protein
MAMKRQFTRGIMAVLVVGALIGVGATWAQMGGVVEPAGTDGSIDWTKGVVTATGFGAPPPNAVNAGQARAMAERAAFLVATRNLLETVKGIRVDSATLVENMIVSSDVIKTEVSGFVQGAQIIKKQVSPDGSVQVTVAMKLNGDFSNAFLPQSSGGVEVIPMPQGQAPPATAFTGLIVDARGIGVRPAVAPKIRNEEGREVYGSAFVNRQYAVEQGMVGYLKDVESAKGNPRVTDRPLMVKALKTDGPNKTDLVISNSDAQVLHGMKEHLTFLEKARVMVILD